MERALLSFELSRGQGIGVRMALWNTHASFVGDAGERSVRFEPKFEVKIQRIEKIHETHRPRRTQLRGRCFECVPRIDEQVADAPFDVANLRWSEHAFPAAN